MGMAASADRKALQKTWQNSPDLPRGVTARHWRWSTLPSKRNLFVDLFRGPGLFLLSLQKGLTNLIG
jgi:hypothetical protein